MPSQTFVRNARGGLFYQAPLTLPSIGTLSCAEPGTTRADAFKEEKVEIGFFLVGDYGISIVQPRPLQRIFLGHRPLASTSGSEQTCRHGAIRRQRVGVDQCLSN